MKARNYLGDAETKTFEWPFATSFNYDSGDSGGTVTCTVSGSTITGPTFSAQYAKLESGSSTWSAYVDMTAESFYEEIRLKWNYDCNGFTFYLLNRD